MWFAAGWGNSEKIAHKHYLQVTDEHFQEAAVVDEKSAAKSGAEAVQNTVQQPVARSRTQQQETRQPVVGSGVVRDASLDCKALREVEAP